jgi:hypothetical protein
MGCGEAEHTGDVGHRLVAREDLGEELIGDIGGDERGWRRERRGELPPAPDDMADYAQLVRRLGHGADNG